VVVLHELSLCRYTQFGMPVVPVGLGEEPPFVGVNRGLDHDEAGKTDRKCAHGGGDYRSIFAFPMRAAMTRQPDPVPVARWEHGPPHPQLEPGALHLWRADLARVPEELCELLSGTERARAERFLNPPGGRLWARSRALLRSLLGRYLQSDPRRLRMAAGPHGKPVLAPPSPLCFNLSHSGELALLAFTTAGAVGVDVEAHRRPIDTLALAARTFGAAEASRLGRLHPAAREREFLRAWVRQEAALKCLGIGIGGAAAAAEAAESLWIAELEMGPAAAGAVALGAAPDGLCCWDWDAS
jgi:4'-phosphopantetheinyl transferase